jgi:hypothetical protein
MSQALFFFFFVVVVAAEAVAAVWPNTNALREAGLEQRGEPVGQGDAGGLVLKLARRLGVVLRRERRGLEQADVAAAEARDGGHLLIAQHAVDQMHRRHLRPQRVGLFRVQAPADEGVLQRRGHGRQLEAGAVDQGAVHKQLHFARRKRRASVLVHESQSTPAPGGRNQKQTKNEKEKKRKEKKKK